MQDSAKYLIHARFEANGVVERSDVVGAIFGQTEGLLGEDLDLRTLQESSKVGRIDVEVQTEAGRSRGDVTIASGLDRVETAILAASLEAIDRVGPCRADVEVTELEDVRTAKRREIVDRAEQLLAAFDEEAVSSDELVEEVRRRVRVDRITDYEGLPAGPRVTDSDAIIVVEGRADVLTMLEYGIKNAVAVEGTDVPDAIADLTHDRTVTAFLDGDRGGDLILRELAQVASVDYVAFAPEGRSVEDLSRSEVTGSLREKVPYEAVLEDGTVTADSDATDRTSLDSSDSSDSETDDQTPSDGTDTAQSPSDDVSAERKTTGDGSETDTAGDGAVVTSSGNGSAVEAAEPTSASESEDESATTGETDGAVSATADDAVATTAAADEGAATPQADERATVATDGETATTAQNETESTAVDQAGETLDDHVQAVIGDSVEAVRLLDDSLATLAESPAGEAFEAVRGADPVPATVVLDGEVTQRLLDVAAQRGVSRIVATSAGEFVKQPASVRVSVVSEA
ncbi:DNA primase DnaG [Halorhabdus rudnickae]|uniref:DNA primase DnaG n=1 Tax=Halorhabdus rudnickae TaxID=1775544 RepID=UPI001083D303|nr:DNA primase DnaG [Halorhabdus rudnickae]